MATFCRLFEPCLCKNSNCRRFKHKKNVSTYFRWTFEKSNKKAKYHLKKNQKMKWKSRLFQRNIIFIFRRKIEKDYWVMLIILNFLEVEVIGFTADPFVSQLDSLHIYDKPFPFSSKRNFWECSVNQKHLKNLFYLSVLSGCSVSLCTPRNKKNRGKKITQNQAVLNKVIEI